MSSATLRSEEAYRNLRRVIACQEIPPGTWLRQRTIAAKLGMSPTPLVQALRRLEHEGLLECVPQWGVRVRALTVDQLEQVFHMRVALESIVFRKLATKLPEITHALNKLRPLAEEVDRGMAVLEDDMHTGRRKIGAINPQDHEFHLSLARLSGMDMVVSELDRLCLLSATIVVLVPNPVSGASPSHVQLLDAILTGNPVTAEAAIRAAIEPALGHELVELRKRFGDGPIIFDNDGKDKSGLFSD